MKLNEIIERNDAFALVKRADIKTGKNGKYLDLILVDKETEISAKYWDYELKPVEISLGDVVKIRATASEFNNIKQLRIEQIRLATPEDNVNVADLTRASEYPSEDMFNEIYNLINDFSDEDLKKLTLKIFDDKKEKLLFFPAATRLHHAMYGGLLYHTLSVMKIALQVCKVYPNIDKDLLLCGAALHDIGKLDELESNEYGIAGEYTTDGQLVGHLIRGTILVRMAGEELNIPEEKIRLVEHMILSHHGIPEHGSVVRPKFTEAAVLSALDDLDAKIFEWFEATAEAEANTFTNRQWALDDVRVYNHGRTTPKPSAKLL
ncbi:MAG: HD domain-containing protein [Ruminococcaceae bacterium]|nr:HD domain-containing protein [Oscillospiraceae bacterium]